MKIRAAGDYDWRQRGEALITRLTAEAVRTVYENELLGPAGHGSLQHYENRLKEALDEDTYRIAMEIQAEAATQGAFGADARRCLQQSYSKVMPDVRDRIDEALDVLLHDGHLEEADDGHRLAFRLLEDWLCARFRDHHIPLQERGGMPQ